MTMTVQRTAEKEKKRSLPFFGIPKLFPLMKKLV